MIGTEAPAPLLEEPVSTWTRDLVCPRCGRLFAKTLPVVECASCQLTWPVIDGIPHFITEFPYWGEMPIEQMREVNRRARAESWKAALIDTNDHVVKRAAEMILNLNRANWHWLVDLPQTSRVLDLGAGCGTNAHGLGMYYRDVVAVEPVAERVEFMLHRFRQEKLTNVNVIRTSLWQLPFAAGSFDLIAMNGVLEWVAEGRNEDPSLSQHTALRNVHRLLRPSGYLYLGIENRRCLGSFRGYPDPHCGLPWVTGLPRHLAHWYAKRHGFPNGYRNYLYSSRGYRQLLRRAGFTEIEIYLALPSYNHPRFLIPLQKNIFSYYKRGFDSTRGGRLRGAFQRLLLGLGLLMHTEYSFAIVARKLETGEES